MQYDIKKIASRLVVERKAHKLSQEDLAATLKVNRNTLSSWETAYKDSDELPRTKHLLKLCELYNCELAYLLGEIDCKTRAATDIHRATGLTEKSIQVLTELIKACKDVFGIDYANMIIETGILGAFIQLVSMQAIVPQSVIKRKGSEFIHRLNKFEMNEYFHNELVPIIEKEIANRKMG